LDSNQKQPKRYRTAKTRKRGPSQRKLGRPRGSFKEIDTAKLVVAIAEGLPVPVACAAVGIDQSTFCRWLDQRPEFAQALAAEKQRVILEALGGIRTGSKDNEWRNHAWLLEHVYPQYFAPTPQMALGVQQNTFVISIEKAKEIEDQRARLLPEVNAMLGLTNWQNNGEELASDK
jgi:hypothetical protein